MLKIKGSAKQYLARDALLDLSEGDEVAKVVLRDAFGTVYGGEHRNVLFDLHADNILPRGCRHRTLRPSYFTRMVD
jgi:hypothetical protein